MIESSADPFDGPRELDLTPERMPRTLWLAGGIPAWAAALVFWLTRHWQELPYRGYVDDSDWLWRRGAYEGIVRGIIGFLVFEMWVVVYGLAQWYGSPRTPDRQARFDLTLANAWFVALTIPAIQLGITLDLSWRGTVLCVTMAGAGLGGLVWSARRTRHETATAAPSSQVAYFDRHDPALFGVRGFNLGNPWLLALLAAGLLPSIVIALMAWMQLR